MEGSVRIVSIALLVLMVGLTCITTAEAQAPDRTYIAVLDLELDANVPEAYGVTLSNRLRQELLGTGAFAVIERGRMNDILAEQGLQLSGCTSDECAVEAGRLLGVEEMVAGSVGRVGSTYSVILRRIDVESGEIIDAQNVDCPCEIEEVLTVSLKQAAILLAGVEYLQPPTRSSGNVFPRSLIVSGWGQRAAGRPAMGWTLTIAQFGTLGYLGYAAIDYADKTSKYEDAKAAYDNNTDPRFGEELYQARIDADQAASEAYDMVNVAIAAAGGVYVLNLVDGILFGGGSTSTSLGQYPEGRRHSFGLTSVTGGGSRRVPAISIRFNLDSGRR
jgi:hypothetical protein